MIALVRAVGEISAGLGFDYLPVALSTHRQTTRLDSSAADLRVLAVSNPRVTVQTTPCGATAALITRLLAKVDSRSSSFGGLTASEAGFLIRTPLSRGVRWSIVAAIPAHLADRETDAFATLRVVELEATSHGATFTRISTSRRRGAREITYSARACGTAGAVKGPALVEALLISLALATNSSFTHPLQPT